MRPLRTLLPLLAVLMVAAACTPTTDLGAAAPAPTTTTSGDEMSALERTAWEAWHLMQIGFLRTGVYSTSVLVDLPLPQGVRWSVTSFDETDYSLAVTRDDGGTGFRVAPDGVTPAG